MSVTYLGTRVFAYTLLLCRGLPFVARMASELLGGLNKPPPGPTSPPAMSPLPAFRPRKGLFEHLCTPAAACPSVFPRLSTLKGRIVPRSAPSSSCFKPFPASHHPPCCCALYLRDDLWLPQNGGLTHGTLYSLVGHSFPVQISFLSLPWISGLLPSAQHGNPPLNTSS